MATTATKAACSQAIIDELASAIDEVCGASHTLGFYAEEVVIAPQYAATPMPTAADYRRASTDEVFSLHAFEWAKDVWWAAVLQRLRKGSENWRSKRARVEDLLPQVPSHFIPYEGEFLSDTWPSQVKLHLFEMEYLVPRESDFDDLWFQTDHLPGYGVLSWAWRLKVGRLLEFRKAAHALVVPPTNDVEHSVDFRSAVWNGQSFSFTANQTAVVRVLWEHYGRGTPDVGDETLLLAVDPQSPPSKLSDVFRNNTAWGTMIVAGGTKGTHRLAGKQ